MLVRFGMIAPGIIIKHIFKYVTEKKVRGLAGRLWTGVWIVVWGSVIIEGFMGAGLFESLSPIDVVPPVWVLVKYLVC